MSVSVHQAPARRADLSRPAEPDSVFRRREVRPRRARRQPTSGASRTAGRTVVGAIAGAALVGGLAMAAPTPAAAQSVSNRLPTLHVGASSSLVVRLQRELSAYGPNVPDTGYFGHITRKRVKRLQRQHGWKATGAAGPRVWRALLSDGHRVSSPSIKPYLSGHRHRTGGGTTTSASRNSVWDKIAKCESGGNWHINTGNGFYGGLQFTLSTWHAYGGSGMPNHHTRANQIRVAQRVQHSQGWGAWPTCSARIGLR